MGLCLSYYCICNLPWLPDIFFISFNCLLLLLSRETEPIGLTFFLLKELFPTIMVTEKSSRFTAGKLESQKHQWYVSSPKVPGLRHRDSVSVWVWNSGKQSALLIYQFKSQTHPKTPSVKHPGQYWASLRPSHADRINHHNLNCWDFVYFFPPFNGLEIIHPMSLFLFFYFWDFISLSLNSSCLLIYPMPCLSNSSR